MKFALIYDLLPENTFFRIEDDLGSYWTCDDIEFNNKKHLTRGRPKRSSLNLK
jgi:hypothetical protein